MSKSKSSGNLTDVRVERPRRHTQGPSELVETHRLPKVSTKSNPEFYQESPKASRSEFTENVGDYGRSAPKVSNNYVYVNTAYVGSVDNVNENRLNPPTSVIREQYWACSKWPYTQRVLAIAVGVLVGAVIGLAVSVSVMGKDPEDILPGFLTVNSAPD